MKKLMFLMVMSSMSFLLLAQAINWQWAVGTGASLSNLADEGYAITVDGQGNLYVTGYFQYAAFFGTELLMSAGSNDIFVAKLDSNGNFIWAREAGGVDSDRGYGIAVDSAGNVYITGGFEVTAHFGTFTLTSSSSTWDPYVAKLDTNGNWQWAVKGGGSGTEECGWDIAVDSSSNVYVSERFRGTATFGNVSLTSYGSDDIFVAKLNSSGTWQWASKAGTTAGDEGKDIALDSAGNIYVTGFFDGTATFGAISIASYNSSDDIFVAKLNNSGTWLWAKQAGTSTDETGHGIAVDSSSNVYVTGFYDGAATFGTISLSSVSSSDDIFVAKLDSSGNWIWASSAGGSDTDVGYKIAVNNNSELFVTGGIDGTAYFGSISIATNGSTTDPFVAKLSSSGTWLWAVNGGGTGGTEFGYGIAIDSYSSAYVTGRYQGSASFGSTNLNSNGNYDIFIARYGYTPPASPSNLIVTNVTSSQINLSWADNSTIETGYRVERKTGVGGTWSLIANLGANATAYTNSGLTQHTTYYYRVRAINMSVYSLYSNEANATTLYTTPQAPTNLTAIPLSSSRISLAWTDNTTVETGYRIERKTGPDGTWSQIASVGTNVTSYIDGDLPQHTNYIYRVRAVNEEVYSAYSNEANATTFYTTPPTPTGLTATVTSASQINLTWSDNSAVETSYFVERKTGESGSWEEIASLAANSTAYSDTGLEQNTIYFYRVRALNVEVYSNYSNEANATTPYATPLSPSNLTVTNVTSSQISLAWDDNATNETGFRIERKIGSGGTWAQLASVDANVTTYTNTGLTQHTTYVYRVQAQNVNVYSGYSNEATATTLYTTPGAPTNLSVIAVSSSQINLTWADNSTVETGYRIERKTGLDGTWAEITSLAANTASYSNTGLEEHTTYYYRVRAINVDVYSSYSNEANATTPYSTPATPGNLDAIAVSFNQIDLTWTDNAINETAYSLERRTGQMGPWIPLASLAANTEAYSDSGLQENTVYIYRVQALNVEVYSDYSNEAEATTPYSTPDFPGNLTATTMSASQIDLSWSDNSPNETGFSIERRLGDGGVWEEIGTVEADISSFSSLDLLPYTTYSFRIRAFNAYGYSDYSETASATTLLGTPVNIVVTRFLTNTIIMWDNVNGAQSYYVYRSLDPFADNWGSPVAHTASAVYMDTSALVRCFYRIIASSQPLGVKSEDPFFKIPED